MVVGLKAAGGQGIRAPAPYRSRGCFHGLRNLNPGAKLSKERDDAIARAAWVSTSEVQIV